jgi:hypothetical protein
MAFRLWTRVLVAHGCSQAKTRLSLRSRAAKGQGHVRNVSGQGPPAPRSPLRCTVGNRIRDAQLAMEFLDRDKPREIERRLYLVACTTRPATADLR